jgi:hypothetical protein
MSRSPLVVQRQMGHSFLKITNLHALLSNLQLQIDICVSSFLAISILLYLILDATIWLYECNL